MWIERHNVETGELRETRELADSLAFEISMANGYLTVSEVKAALLSGHRVYTSLNYWVWKVS